MLKKFENYIDDLLNKEAIDNASYIEFKAPNGDIYQHYLEFVLPYHENIVLSRKTKFVGAYDMTDYKFKFTKFENDFGGLGTGLLKRSLTTSGIVYDGKLYRNDQYDLGSYQIKSKKENKPLYVLKFVSVKNGVKRYSEKGLEYLKEKYPELVYNKN